MASGSPLEYFSRKLMDTERRYYTFNHKLLAALGAVCHFRWMLSAFAICTNHKPLVYAICCLGEPWSP